MTKTGKRKHAGRNLVLILMGTVIAVAAIFLVSNQNQSNAEDTVTTAQAVRMTIETSLESDGEIESSLEENVEPYTSYYLEEIKVEAGQALSEGDVILTYTNGYEMTAPYNCVVEGWNLPEEEEQLTSDHYVTIAGTDVMQMTISVNESNIAAISLGDKATVTVSATGGVYDAEISYISQVGSYSNGNSTFTARVTFDNDGTLKLGMSGSATISLERAENVVAVPVSAVNTKGKMSFVSVMSETGEVTQTEVETGISNDSFIEIKSGVNEGDAVVVTVSEDSSSGAWTMPGGMGGFSGMPDGAGGPGSGGGNRPGGSSSGSGGSGSNGGNGGGRRSGNSSGN